MQINKKLVNFRRIIPEDKLEPRERVFLEKIIEPAIKELEFNLSEQEIILNRYKAVIENRESFKSKFPTNKEYDREIIGVEGIRKIGDPVEMARQLILGLISRKDKTVKKSFEFYQPEIINRIRPQLNPARVYKNIEAYLKSKNTTENAKAMLNLIIQKDFSNHNGLGSIVNFIVEGLDNPKSMQKHKSLVTRLNKRTIDLSISHSKYGCCAFWGIVERDKDYRKNLDSRYHGSVLYLTDPEIGILFHHIEEDGNLNMPTGAVIMADVLGTEILSQSKKEERYLLIDSIEVYRPEGDERFPDNPLREIKQDTWRKLTYNSIFEVAKDIGASKIFYNPKFFNEGGNTFTKYLKNRMLKEGIRFKENQKAFLRKENGRKFIPGYYNDSFGFFLDCMIPKDNKHFCGYHAIKGNYFGKAQCEGLIVDLK